MINEWDEWREARKRKQEGDKKVMTFQNIRFSTLHMHICLILGEITASSAKFILCLLDLIFDVF